MPSQALAEYQTHGWLLMDVMEALAIADMKQALDAAPDAKSRPTGELADLITQMEFEDAAKARKKDDEPDG